MLISFFKLALFPSIIAWELKTIGFSNSDFFLFFLSISSSFSFSFRKSSFIFFALISSSFPYECLSKFNWIFFSWINFLFLFSSSSSSSSSNSSFSIFGGIALNFSLILFIFIESNFSISYLLFFFFFLIEKFICALIEKSFFFFAFIWYFNSSFSFCNSYINFNNFSNVSFFFK